MLLRTPFKKLSCLLLSSLFCLPLTTFAQHKVDFCETIQGSWTGLWENMKNRCLGKADVFVNSQAGHVQFHITVYDNLCSGGTYMMQGTCMNNVMTLSHPQLGNFWGSVRANSIEIADSSSRLEIFRR